MATGTLCGVGAGKAPTYENANASISTSAGISARATAFGVGVTLAIKVPRAPWSRPQLNAAVGLLHFVDRQCLRGGAADHRPGGDVEHGAVALAHDGLA